jgi:glycosyltransferase involved in cell wall biosynthesis
VLAGNRYLADYALQFNSNVHIFPTTIDTETYVLRAVSENGAVCIGWSGSFSTVQHFEHAFGALMKIKAKYGNKVAFKVIGDANYKNDALQIKGIAWRSETEVSDLQSLDIGIMPLPNDEWAKGKCGLKGLQYMAVGVPAVMSPVGVNTEIIKDGVNGFLAATEEEWVDKLSRLIDSEALRRQFSAQGRKTVEENYSVAANRKRYLELFMSVASRKNKSTAKASARIMS